MRTEAVIPPGYPDSVTSQATPEHDLRGVLRLKSFRRLWLSLGLSSFGDWLGLLASTAMAASLGAQNSYAAANLAVSGVLILRLAPAVLLGPLAGVFADRFDRKLTMVVGDLIRFVLFLSIPIVGTLWWLFIATVLAEIVGLFWLPAKDATVPNLVPRERLEAANQLGLATTYGSAPVAALLFSGLSLVAGIIDNVVPWIGTAPDVAMYANAFTNLVAALVIWRLDMPKGPAGSKGSAEPSLWRSLIDGWSFVTRTKLVRGLVLGMLGAFGAGGFVIGVAPTFVKDLGAGAPAYGLLFAAVFAGLAVGMWIGPRLLPDFTRWRLFAVSIVVAGVWLCCLAVFPNSVMAVIFTLLVGLAGGVAWVTGYTLLGLEVADEVRGRTFAFVQNGARIVLIGVMAVAPGLAALFGERTVAVSEVELHYNGAAFTLGLAGVIALLIGLISYRAMNDHTSLSLADDLASAWRNRPTRAADEAARPRYPGYFIAFEGGDGVGKTSQIRLLETWLKVDRGEEVITTREPGATELGSAIRQLVLHGAQMDPHAEALLFAADRAQHVQTVVLPALKRGAFVITDRYIDSSIAYQGGGRGFDQDGIDRISTWAASSLVPDLTIVLDLDPAVARKRMAAAGVAPDRLEAEEPAFHARVRETFLARARRYPRRYLVIDASADPLDISEQIKARLRKTLPPGPVGAERIRGDKTAAPTEMIHLPADSGAGHRGSGGGLAPAGGGATSAASNAAVPVRSGSAGSAASPAGTPGAPTPRVSTPGTAKPDDAFGHSADGDPAFSGLTPARAEGAASFAESTSVEPSSTGPSSTGSSPGGPSPAESTRAGTTFAGSSPAESSPAESTRAGGTSAGSSPAEPTPAEPTPAEPTPAESTPAGSTAAEPSPARPDAFPEPAPAPADRPTQELPRIQPRSSSRPTVPNRRDARRDVPGGARAAVRAFAAKVSIAKNDPAPPARRPAEAWDEGDEREPRRSGGARDPWDPA